jgi:diguanylate cyclase
MHASSNRPQPADAAHLTQELLRRLAGQSGGAGELERALDGLSLQRMAHAMQNDAVFMQQAVLAASERIHRLEAELARARALCCEDELTGCFNRRGTEQAYARETARAGRTHQPLTAALIDLDDFKRINDSLGHAIGDLALIHVTELARSVLRASDIIGRWGGEEFMLLLPDTGLAAAQQALERLQQSLRQQPLRVADQTLTLTFSGGLTHCSADEDCDTMLQRADSALYAAKRAGKDCVMVR